MNYNKCLTNARLIGAGMAIGVYISSAAIAQAQTAKVLCLGDSITAGATSTASLGEDKAYPSLLQGMLNAAGKVKFQVSNNGVNGLQADGLLKKLKSDKSLLNNDPDAVTIMIGTNDIDRAKDKDAAVAATFKTIQACVTYIRTYKYADGKAPKICVAAVIPMRDDRDKIPYIQKLNEMLASSLKGTDAFIPDTFTRLYDAKTGTASRSLLADNLHPNEAGQKVLAEVFLKALMPQAAATSQPTTKPAMAH